MHEFQVLVRRLHEAGIEVILDVVYNHTAEGNHLGPTLSFRGIDNASYYMLAADKHFYFDTTGCGNTVNLRHPRVLQMVMDSLRYWVEECHVDGFRFDLATSLGREYDSFDPNAVFFDAVRQDPVLSRVKMIAEPWDVGPNGYQVGNFPPGWAEWNGRYRDEMRSYWKGDSSLLPAFSRSVLGSADLFEHQGRKPWASVNFITAHDGFTLTDLWSYNSKHNEANGEGNRDGHDDNRSWNCGVEGPTDDPAILDLRDRMRRGIMATLLLSQGTPMILMGDEVGRTQNGNNNAYCQDNEIAWLEWKDVSDRDRAFMEFVRGVIRMRKRYRILRANRFLHGEPVDEKGTRSVVWFRPDGQGDGPAVLERHQRQGHRPAPLRRRHAAPHPRQLLSPADPVHAARVRRRRAGRCAIDSGTGEIDPPDRRFAPGARSSSRPLAALLAGEIGEAAARTLQPPPSSIRGRRDQSRGGDPSTATPADSSAPPTSLPRGRLRARDASHERSLDRLASMVGIEPSYFALTGEVVKVSDDAKRAVLKAMGIAAGDEDEIAASLATVCPDPPRSARSARRAPPASCPTG